MQLWRVIAAHLHVDLADGLPLVLVLLLGEPILAAGILRARQPTGQIHCGGTEERRVDSGPFRCRLVSRLPVRRIGAICCFARATSGVVCPENE